MSAWCLTCSLRKILFSVNLFVNLFIRKVCSFRSEHFARHFKWLFEFNSWSTALQCIVQLQILFAFSFSVCHSLRNSKVVTAFTVVQLKNSKPVTAFCLTGWGWTNIKTNVFVNLCTLCYAVKLCMIVWICVKFYSASANYNFVAVQVIHF